MLFVFLSIPFDILLPQGIWNEDAWTRAYVKSFRTALDAAQLNDVQLVLGDGTPTASECRDCPSSWKSLSDALAQDAELLAAVRIMGVHNAGPLSPMPGNWSRLPAVLWNSEQNVVDDPMPQVGWEREPDH